MKGRSRKRQSPEVGRAWSSHWCERNSGGTVFPSDLRVSGHVLVRPHWVNMAGFYLDWLVPVL